MKKARFLAFLVVGALLSNGAKADINCAGGEIFTTTVNGQEKNFCISKIELNWWSAMAWCRAHGLELATIANACGKTVTPDSSCLSFKEMLPTGYVMWLQEGPTLGQHYELMPSTASTYYFFISKTSTTLRKALCQEP